MSPRGRSRQVRQVATNVPAIGSANRAQESNEMSSNPHDSMKRSVE